MSFVDTLKKSLLQQECHFTWSLREEDFHVHDLVNRLEEQIQLESGKARVTRAYNSLAFVCYLYDDFHSALSNLHKSEELAKAHYGKDSEKFLIVTYGNLAWLYYDMEIFDLCEDYLRQLEKIRGKISEDFTNEVHCEVLKEKGWAFLKFSRKYYNGARECFRRALEMNPKDSDLNTGYAIAWYRTSLDPPGTRNSQTVEQLRRAIDLNPDDAVLLMFLALRLLNNREISASPKTAKNDPFQLCDCSEAVSLVIRALEMSPENPHVMRYVAKFSRMLGSVDFAICKLEKMLSSNPNSAFAHHQLALCYKAKKIFFEKKYGPCDKVETPEAQHCLRKCVYHLKEAISLKPSFIVALAELALHYGQMKNIAKAEELFQQAFQTAHEKREHVEIVHALYGQFQLYSKRSEKLAIYHYMQGLMLQEHKQDSKCETELKNISRHRFSRNPDDSKAWAIEGYVHEMRGENLKATEYYQKALTNQKFEREKEDLLLTSLRIWVLGFQEAENSARDLILGGPTHDVQDMGHGRPKIINGTMVKKTVNMVEADLCNAKKTLLREKSVLTPGPHAIVLAFSQRHGQFTLDTKKMLENLEIFGESVWKHVIVLFTEDDIPIRNYIGAQGSVLQWLLEKCENRHYITGIGSQIAQSAEFSERIMKMISKNNTMHLVIPDTSSKLSSFKMIKESSIEKSELFAPKIITEQGQSVYRFKCSRAGWFQCTFTQLGFRMMGEGELLYTTVEQDSSCPVSTNHYAAGPLYDIKCVQGELSELQFPHCEESPEKCNFMTVVHYTGDNVEVLEPQSVSHTHVKVNVTGTSCFCLQNVLNWFTSKITGHVALIYYPRPKHWLHVFLQPCNADPEKVKKSDKDCELILGPSNFPLEYDTKYNILCNQHVNSEQAVRPPIIQPEFAHFKNKEGKYYTPDFEIRLSREMMNVQLELQQHCTGETVWDYKLPCLKVYQKKTGTMDRRTCSTFLSEKREQIIQNVINVDLILDHLDSYIHSEIIENIKVEKTHKKQMRELIKVVEKAGLQLMFIQAIEKVQPNLLD